METSELTAKQKVLQIHNDAKCYKHDKLDIYTITTETKVLSQADSEDQAWMKSLKNITKKP